MPPLTNTIESIADRRSRMARFAWRRAGELGGGEARLQWRCSSGPRATQHRSTPRPGRTQTSPLTSCLLPVLDASASGTPGPCIARALPHPTTADGTRPVSRRSSPGSKVKTLPEPWRRGRRASSDVRSQKLQLQCCQSAAHHHHQHHDPQSPHLRCPRRLWHAGFPGRPPTVKRLWMKCNLACGCRTWT